MDNRDLPRRRYDGYYEGSSGRSFQHEWDDEGHGGGSFQSYGDEARWKNSTRAEHFNNDQFGRGNTSRTWSKNLDNHEHHRGHFGKGPKGYVRARERIFEDVCEALAMSPIVDAQDIEVSVDAGLVTLTGTVVSRKMKRAAEDIIYQVLGVEDVINMLSLQGEAKGDQIDESGSPLGGNPNQESKTGNWT